MNWYDRIDEAIQNGGFSLKDQQLAADWVTCACGEQDKDIPRYNTGAPKDMMLLDAGVAFAHYIGTDSFENARSTLELIQHRVIQILHDIELEKYPH